MTEEYKYKTINLPPSTGNQYLSTEISCDPSVVIVGANGSGKTRIGTWLEILGPDSSRAYRIPAQRSLRFPSSASPIGMQAAIDTFQFADRPPHWSDDEWEGNKKAMRLSTRYGGANLESIATAQVTDFDKLLVLLFSENYTSLLKFDADNDATERKLASPVSTLKRVKKVWESVLTHRLLEFASGEVRVKTEEQDNNPYLATGMSDGERVIFYLIGHCLCAPKSSLIIIDEPELHLHRSVQKRLWDAIEAERPDCQFVYITHDLAFAEGRVGALKVWLVSSTDATYNWKVLDSVNGIPDDLYYEVLGSRRPIIFSEGTHNSIDIDVYSAAYPEFLIRPVGSCSQVIQTTKAFRDVASLHHISSIGLVDRDYLSQGQLLSLQASGIGSPMVAEIENLFLTPEVLTVMVDKLGADKEAVNKVYDHVFSEFARKLEIHAAALTKRDVNLKLGSFAKNPESASDLERSFNDLVASIDINALYEMYIAEAKALLDAKDYLGILMVFNEKTLINRLNSFFGVTKPSYSERVRALLRKKDTAIVQALSSYLPRPEDLA